MGYCEVEGEVWPAFLFFSQIASLYTLCVLIIFMYIRTLPVCLEPEEGNRSPLPVLLHEDAGN